MIDHKQIWCHETTDVCPFTDEGCDHVEVLNCYLLFVRQFSWIEPALSIYVSH